MADPTPLSPAAQAVLDAAFGRWMEIDDIDDGIPGKIAAAVLRAAADQMAAHHSKTFLYNIADALKLHAIAAELEGGQ